MKRSTQQVLWKIEGAIDAATPAICGILLTILGVTLFSVVAYTALSFIEEVVK